jgi:chromosome segregation ATPase
MEFFESGVKLQETNEVIEQLNAESTKLATRRGKLESEEKDIQRQQADLTAKITDSASETELQAIAQKIEALKNRLNKVQDNKDQLTKEEDAWKEKRRKFDAEYQHQKSASESATKQGDAFNKEVKRHSQDLDSPWVKKAIEVLNRSLGGFGTERE